MDDALAAGEVPVLLAPECSIALTTLPAVAGHRPDAKVLWLDAHGDFNTPQTTASGYLGGMAPGRRMRALGRGARPSRWCLPSASCSPACASSTAPSARRSSAAM